MIQKSKFYAIIETYYSVGMWGWKDCRVVGLALSQLEAEFKVSELKSHDSCRNRLSSSYNNYSFEEVTTIDFVDKNSKAYQKFLREKGKEIQDKIAKEKMCAEANFNNIAELKRELEKYESI